MAMVRSSATFSAQNLLWRHAHLILEKNSSRYYHTYIFKQALSYTGTSTSSKPMHGFQQDPLPTGTFSASVNIILWITSYNVECIRTIIIHSKYLAVLWPYTHSYSSTRCSSPNLLKLNKFRSCRRLQSLIPHKRSLPVHVGLFQRCFFCAELSWSN